MPPSPLDQRAAAQALSAIVRSDWGRLTALLVNRFRRLDLAEDALGDAVVAATKEWAVGGIPSNPAGWLLTAARNRALDRLRSEAVAAKYTPLLVTDARTSVAAQEVLADSGDEVRDEMLRLVFCCAHPALDPSAAAALTLRMVLGVSTADVARLFLVSEATMAARITRAKKKIASAAIPFTIPAPQQLSDRVDVLARIAYLAFTAGYAPGSETERSSAVADEAIRLVQVVLRLLPDQPTLQALLALMLLQHSRRDARVVDGVLVVLGEQDRSRWHHDDIAYAIGILSRLLTDADEASRSGLATEYLLQAMIAAEHAIAPTAGQTNWQRIAGYYLELETLTRSPVVRLNRAVAVAEADGPEAGLELVAGLDEHLPTSHRLPAVRAELLLRTDRPNRGELAAAQWQLAIDRCANDVELSHLRERAASVDVPPAGGDLHM